MHIQELNSNFWVVTAKAPEALTVYEQLENTSLKIINWGRSNKYPQELISAVGSSPIATACLDARVKYMAGDGIVVDRETDFSRKMLEVFNFDNWEQICYSWQWFEECALHLKFDLNGWIVDIINQEASTVRLGIPNAKNEIKRAMISASWELERKLQKYKAKAIDLYSPLETKAKIEKFSSEIAEGKRTIEEFQEWNGALKIIRRKRPGQLYYPSPKYASAIGWIYVDGQVQVFHSTNVDNNFTPGFILYVPFSLEGKTDDGRSKKEAFKQEIRDKWLGADKAGEPAILYGKTPESAPQIIPFSSNGNDKLYIAISDLIVDHICTVTAVPPAIANIQVSKGLNASKDYIINEFDKFLNTEIKPDQNRVLEEINKLIKNFAGYDGTKLSVSNSRPLAYIPEAFKDDYTEDERRESNGYQPKTPAQIQKDKGTPQTPKI